MIRWEVCCHFNLSSYGHNVSSFIWLIFKIFTLSLLFSNFIIMCHGVILCFFYLEFFEFLGSVSLQFSSNSEKFGYYFFKSLLSLPLFFPSFWDSSYKNARLLYIIPQFTKSCSFIFSLFPSLCYRIWHSFYCYAFNFTIFSCSVCNLLLISSSVLFIWFLEVLFAYFIAFIYFLLMLMFFFGSFRIFFRSMIAI